MRDCILPCLRVQSMQDLGFQNEEEVSLTCVATAFQGVEYWRAERDICRRLSRYAFRPPGQAVPCISIEEVHAASQSKSFDYRVRCHAVHASV